MRSSKTDEKGEGIAIQLHFLLFVLCICYGSIWLLAHLVSLNRLSLTRYQFIAVLKKCLVAIENNPLLYKPNSFRVGAATAASQNGLSDENIKRMGHRESGAFESYIRTPSDKLLPTKC